jgi:hypothetical protein
MTVDQQHDGASTPLLAVDWELYRRLQAEGRLNLLFRLAKPPTAWFLPEIPAHRPNDLPFISRAEHLAWRERWKKGRWVKLSWTPEEREAILRQDELYRQADARWELNHGPVSGGARVLKFTGGAPTASCITLGTIRGRE